MVKLETKVAFVSGANGISGNAIIEHLIRTPKQEWSKIIISSRSPLSHYWQDSRVEFVALDFLDPVDSIVKKLEHIATDVTHAFFVSYVHVNDFALLRDTNIPLFKNFLDSLDVVAPKLQHICLQTGGKHYGVHLGPVHAPLVESLPRYEDGGFNFYYQQEDFMLELQKKRTWSYSIIRPNAIIGFTPGANGMSQALTMAIYFLVCREIGENPIFPGNNAIYNSVDDSSYAPGLADMSVWSSTTHQCKNEAFNHTNGDVFIWRYFWPAMAAHFGLEVAEPKFTATGESGDRMERNFSMIDWAKDKKPYWEAVCKKYGGNPQAFDWGSWGFFDWTTGKTWPTISTVNKARKYGWTRQDDTYETWIETFRSFENAGILPREHVLKADLREKKLAANTVLHEANSTTDGH